MSRRCAGLLALGVLLALVACERSGDGNRVKEAPMSNTTAGPERIEFEGIPLLVPVQDLASQFEFQGWKHNIRPGTGDQRVVVFPEAGFPVKRFRLQVEDGVIIGIIAEYAEPNPARIERMKARFAESRHGQAGWTMTDTDRQLLVQLTDTGDQLRVLHAGRARDQREVEAMFRTYLDQP